MLWLYSGPCILRPSHQPEIYGLKLKVVLKWRDVYIENIKVVSLIAGLKIDGIVKYRGLNRTNTGTTVQGRAHMIFHLCFHLPHVPTPKAWS